MTQTFTEFLRQKAAEHGVEAEENQATIAEWRDAVRRLFDQVREWLKQSDPDGIIKIEESELGMNEPGLGRYTIPALNLRCFGNWVGLLPKARRTIGTAKPPWKTEAVRATGRVDMTDDIRRHFLYRLSAADGDAWYIEDQLSGKQSPLDRQTFETALMGYLK